MAFYVSIDTNNLVTLTMRGTVPEPGYREVIFWRPTEDDPTPPEIAPDQIITGLWPDVAILAETMVDAVTGHLVPRPKLVPPAFDAETNILSLTDCPAGTVIEVHDQIGGEVVGTITADTASFADTITFSDAGRYAVEFDPPLPYLPLTFEVQF